jgi:hypothetical protein
MRWHFPMKSGTFYKRLVAMRKIAEHSAVFDSGQHGYASAASNLKKETNDV